MSAAMPNLDLILGPILAGTCANAFVFGICVLQYIQYLGSEYKDDWIVVCLLAWVMMIDTFQTGSSVSLVWYYCVTNFTNVEVLASAPWMYATVPIFSSLAAVPIQHFMAWRIMRFSKSIWLFIFISVLSLTQGALAVTSATMGLTMTSIASHVKIIPVADGWLGTSVACDTSITLLLLYYLNKSRTGFKRTDSILFRLCRITVEAALPVTILCMLDLIFLTTNPFNNLHFMCALPVGRLYTNTLLTTLNARENLRKVAESSGHNSYQLGSRVRNVARTTEVHINVEQDVQMENYKGSAGLTSSGDDIYAGSAPSDIKANLA